MKKFIKLILIITLVIYTKDTIINEMDNKKHNTIDDTIATQHSIILNVEITQAYFINGCVPASSHSLIKYVSGKSIPQEILAKEEYYITNTGTYFIHTTKVLNKYLSNYLKQKQYLYKRFNSNFGKKIEDQISFYKIIYNSLKNKFPIHLAIQGYWNNYYGNKQISHAVVLNGVEKADKIENYTYYIADSNDWFNYRKFKSWELPRLFSTCGEINYYPL